jgi:hypothetical protein
MGSVFLQFIPRLVVLEKFSAPRILRIGSEAVHVAQGLPEPVIGDEVVPTFADLTCAGEGAWVVDEGEDVEG